MACLVDVYADENGRGACAEIEPLLMMRPPRGVWSFMMRKACWLHRNGPVRLVFTTACHCARLRSSKFTGGAPMPALLKSTSSRPKASITLANSAAIDAGSVMSAETGRLL